MRDSHTTTAPVMTWTTATDAAGRTRLEMRWTPAPAASAPVGVQAGEIARTAA